MKRSLLLVLGAGLGFASAIILVRPHQAARFDRELEQRRAAWAAEKAALTKPLAKARVRYTAPTPISLPGTTLDPVPSPEALLARLVVLPVAPGPGQGRALREVLALLEQLTQAGPHALPDLE